MAGIDPNLEWLGHVQPTGLVLAPSVLAQHGLNPMEQTRADSEAVRALLSPPEDVRVLPDAWPFFRDILLWRPSMVAGAPGGPPLPDDISRRVDESDLDLAPHWAVAMPGAPAEGEPKDRWQLLVRIEAPGIKPDGTGVLPGWPGTPHQYLERLLRETGVPTGLLVTDGELRFIHAPRGETSGWMAFPLRSLGEVGGRPMLGGLKLILGPFALFNDAPDRRLVALLKASREAQAEVSTKLASQVLGALHELLRGLHEADRARIEGIAAAEPEHLYEGLLTVLLRLVFLLYAEDRDLIPSQTDSSARRLYQSGYGVRALYARLQGDAAHNPDTMDERRGAWSGLLALFRLVHRGDGSGWIRGRGGKLFDPVAFPFLQGQASAADAPAPAAVSDGCVLRILDRLLNLGGEKLSYRTLDVEQIGSVYETVMGFTVETRPGPALAIKAGKNDRTPVFVDIATLAATKAGERLKWVKENTGRTLSDKVGKAVAAAADEAALLDALRQIVDERGSPGGRVSPAGTPLLQPTDERRRTGSHYTPRSLTHPIVKYALEPAFERLGPDARPEAVLDLKVCDPAMGSGAFLVEACRQLGERLVQAWARWPETRPNVPADEDEQLHARRLVAQRCLYGVDKNPRAVDLARLSLWLATLARDHEFTFLDHALKCGDSLIGLTMEQIAAANWDEGKPGLPLFRQLVRDEVAKVTTGRREIQEAPDDTSRAIQEARHRRLEDEIRATRTVGDAVLSAFFAEDKSKAREKGRAEVESWLVPHDTLQPRWDWLEAAAASLREGEHPVTPFHWQVEFPEVFGRENSGFDAMVGNPPFAGKNTIIAGNRSGYLPWLQTLHDGAHGNADLVAHFFRRTFGLTRDGGAVGLIATKTIGQGDTRDSGLAAVIAEGGCITRATRRLEWPGEAAVVVSVVHLAKGYRTSAVLEGREVRRISAYLVEGDLDQAPTRLAANAKKAFVGSYVSGKGFTFTDDAASKGEAEDLTTMRKIISDAPRSAERIFPYIGGEDVNSSPTHSFHRFVIDFANYPLRRDDSLQSWFLNEGTDACYQRRNTCLRAGIVPADYPTPVAGDWPCLLEIVERLVLPSRINDAREVRRRRWWQFAERASRLYRAIETLDRVMVRSLTSAHFPAFTWLPAGYVYDQTNIVWATSSDAAFCVVASRPHELWASGLGADIGGTGRYNIRECFENFPLPQGFETDPALEAIGEAYHSYRAALMIDRNEGLTKTYNRFHARTETAPDIARLRDLHADLDRAVLTAYGWDDLARDARPEFIEQDADEGKQPKTRLDWPAEFKEEVLARLLALNATRAAEERAIGVVPTAEEDDAEIENEGEEA